MLVNVATLIQERLGSTRDLTIAAEAVEVPSWGYRREVDGTARLIRTGRGVLVTAGLSLSVPLECARCLGMFDRRLEIAFDEEFVLSTPHPLTHELPQHDQDDFLIDEFWHLDLSEAVRQYEESAVPLVPLCRPDCPGFAAPDGVGTAGDADRAGPQAPEAPERRARGSDIPPRADGPGTRPRAVDQRWSALAGLTAELHEEDHDGPA